MTGRLFVTLLFYCVLLLLLICEVLYAKVYATKLRDVSSSFAAVVVAPEKNTVELFKTGQITVELNSTGHMVDEAKSKITATNFYSSFFVLADDVLVVMTGVDCISDNNSVTILSKYIAIEKESKWGEKVITSGEATAWKTQFAVQHEIGNIEGQTSVVKRMLAAANNKEIYLLLVNCKVTINNVDESTGDVKCNFDMTVGTVSNSETANKKITWDDVKVDNTINFEESIKKSEELNGNSHLLGGTAFLTADEKVVFVVLFEDKVNKKFSAVFLFRDGDKQHAVLKVESVDRCIPSFFLWEEKIIMIPTDCLENDESSRKMKELNKVEKKLVDNTGSFARLLRFLQDKSHFTTTKINNTNVLLFTQTKHKLAESADNKNDAYLWFSDGNRVHSTGPIVTDDNIIASHLLQANNELFALCQNLNSADKEIITLKRMKEQLNDIIFVLDAWNRNDHIVQELFKHVASSTEKSSFADGLVGFLSDQGVDSKSWRDEYYYVNATVTGGDKVDGGFTFNGKNAGAKWPVGKLKEDQPYNFTDPGFTLVANVTVDGVTNGKDNSVLGVVYKSNGEEKNNDEKTVGLWCTAKGKWKITGNGGSPKILSAKDKCPRGSAHYVALILNNGELSVYIDGEELAEKEREIKIEKSHNITHFYFGARSDDDESHVTVKNVLLYNRPFTTDEVGKLIIPKKIKPSKPINDRRGGSETPKDKGGDGESPSRSSRTGEVEEKSTSRPESGTVRGGYVGVVVCFVMLAHALCFL